MPKVRIRKVKQNDNLCPVQDSGSLAMFKVTARDQDQYKGPSEAFVTHCNISFFFFFFFLLLFFLFQPNARLILCVLEGLRNPSLTH